MTKPTKWHVRPTKTQISLGICPIWSESLLCAQWVAKDPSFLYADSEDSDQTWGMPRLIWVFAGAHSTLLVLYWGSSFWAGSCENANIHTSRPEPLLFAYTVNGTRGSFRQREPHLWAYWLDFKDLKLHKIRPLQARCKVKEKMFCAYIIENIFPLYC